ncbi:MAG: hypothetical protein AB7L09_13040 [Nitrospira sp.]
MRFIRRRSDQEPSLVPLADMLTNTVGILFFILVFTVLAAGGVVVPKRLPMEHATKAEPAHFVCAGNRLLPFDNVTLIKKLLDPLGQPRSFADVEPWIQRYNTRRVEDPFFVITGEGKTVYTGDSFSRQVRLVLRAKVEPKADSGTPVGDLRHPASVFQESINRLDPHKLFIHFIVKPDCLEPFTEARAIAIEKGFRTGWFPQSSDEIILDLGGSGGSEPTIQ